MAKLYTLFGYFLIGVSSVGLFSYTAYAFPSLRMFSFWLVVTAALMLLVCAIADDWICEILGLSYQNYIGSLVATVAVLILGGVVAWVR